MSYRVIAPFQFESKGSFIRIEPASGFSASCEIAFDQKVIGRQSARFVRGMDDPCKLMESRTFCHIDDVNAMRRRGLALGGSLENAIVVSESGVVNDEGLRSPNEFAYHKLLDLLGDISLLGRNLVGQISSYKPGHTLHADFMRELLSDIDRYLEPCQSIPPRFDLSRSFYAFG